MDIIKPILVAHRGDCTNYPENTLLSLASALQVGAQAVEFDIQLTADLVPVLFHDESLSRVAGVHKSILNCDFKDLANYRAYEPDRFGNQFQSTPISTLHEAVELLQAYPGVRAFVEIKRESLARFGIGDTLLKICQAIEPIRNQCMIISFESNVLVAARQLEGYPIGWVIRHYDEKTRVAAESLQPDLLCCSLKKIPHRAESLWPGNWQWMLEETSKPKKIAKYAALGIDYLETNDITGMLAASTENTIQ